jgi:hypothetical protein
MEERKLSSRLTRTCEGVTLYGQVHLLPIYRQRSVLVINITTPPTEETRKTAETITMGHQLMLKVVKVQKVRFPPGLHPQTGQKTF